MLRQKSVVIFYADSGIILIQNVSAREHLVIVVDLPCIAGAVGGELVVKQTGDGGESVGKRTV